MSEEAQTVEPEQIQMDLEPGAGEVTPEPEVDDTTSGDEVGAEAPADSQDDVSSIRAEMEDLRERTRQAEARSDAAQNVFTQNLTYQDKVRQQQEEQAAIENMTPAERLQYQGELEKRELRQIAQSTQAQLADQTDKNDFAMMAMDNPVARQHKDEVEKRLQEAHAAGFSNVKRATVLKDLLGEKVLESAMSGNTKQVQAAKETQAKSTAKASVNTGDVGGGEDALSDEDTKRDARNERLANKHTAYQ